LHDLGKLFIPSSILNRESGLTEEEWEVMKLHSACGGQASQRDSALAQEVVDVITYHHERWDGKGYPAGLSGSGIPYFARICALIDTFDSMLSDRCYRKGLPYEVAVNEIRKNSGTQFDPALVEPFIAFSESSSFPMMLYKLSIAI
jgi:HD-GYP domain-containing protein (c-di-GMP phosphodiesterase class II)